MFRDGLPISILRVIIWMSNYPSAFPSCYFDMYLVIIRQCLLVKTNPTTQVGYYSLKSLFTSDVNIVAFGCNAS